MNIVMQSVKKIDNVLIFSYVIALMIYVISYIAGYSMDIPYEEADISFNIWDIFVNNTIISLIFFAGILSFGFVNIGIAGINGFSIGSLMSYSSENLALGEILWNIIPHGVFEIPSLLISTSVGFLPILLLIKKAHSKKKINYRFYLKYIGLAFVLVLLLNIAAAVVEITITMK
ncbi:stage II sporulation protein M [Halobacillus sp. B23F22_1]|uniref:stage II sporulation protein M n=1 Tax=Halobacillus sp. B23F22_1 TaxID=3459514 RepID=UPI00373E97EC